MRSRCSYQCAWGAFQRERPRASQRQRFRCVKRRGHDGDHVVIDLAGKRHARERFEDTDARR